MIEIPAPPLVRVVWEDAACLDADTTWVTSMDEPQKYEPVIITSVGFLLFQGPAGVIITGAWTPERMGPRDQIPAGMLREVTFLQPVPGKTKKTR